MQFKKRKFGSELRIQGNLMHPYYAPNYGEVKKPYYAILNFGSHYIFNRYTFNLKMGIENILDSEYTTFADRNTIPRMGRNGFTNVLFSF
ncbi:MULTISPECIES: hypothetical protein [Flavobacterium]|uniref:TonB dependent receptor n=1 Tax=Flavobacterium jumunjinense TaxID=998845 RepID=A0ABV5GRJ5_9FLAO|nr:MULTISPECIES: hypothetical protein [Flavobacterium]